METSIEEYKDSFEQEHISTITEDHYYAGFWMRLWAYLLDLLVIASLTNIIIKPVFGFLNIPLTSSGLLSYGATMTFILSAAYLVLMTKFFGQTVGKMVFGLKVISKDNESLTWLTVIFREVIGKFISKAIFLIGFIFAAFTQNKQALHDIIADSFVILEKNR